MSDELYYNVHIKQNSTNTVNIYKDIHNSQEEKDGALWYWTEGNAGCDCNREIFFYRSIGVEIMDKLHQCGDDRFSVNIYDEDNNLIHEEFNNE